MYKVATNLQHVENNTSAGEELQQSYISTPGRAYQRRRDAFLNWARNLSLWRGRVRGLPWQNIPKQIKSLYELLF